MFQRTKQLVMDVAHDSQDELPDLSEKLSVRACESLYVMSAGYFVVTANVCNAHNSNSSKVLE